MTADIGIVVVLVACNFTAEVGGENVFLADSVELNLGEHQAFVFAMKFVDFNGVFPVLYEVARLLYALAAEREEFVGIIEGNLLFPFETAYTVSRRSLDGEISLVATGAHTYCVPMSTTDIALLDVVLGIGQGAVAVVGNEKLAFNFFHESEVFFAKIIKKKNLWGNFWIILLIYVILHPKYKGYICIGSVIIIHGRINIIININEPL